MPPVATEPMPRARPVWLLIAGAGLVPAVLNAFTSYINSRFRGQGSADWGSVVFASGDWLFFGALTPITYVLARRYPLRREAIGRAVVAHCAGALVLCIAWASLGMLLGLLLHRFPAQEDLLRGYVGWILTSLPWSVFLYLLVLGCTYAFTYYREARERESQQARL